MFALGIDGSLSRTALVLLPDNGSPPRTWVIETKASESLTTRLRRIAYSARRIADATVPDVIAMEEPGFLGTRAGQSATAIFRAQGALIAALPSSTPLLIVPVHEWRRDLGIKMRRGEGKAPIIEWCRDVAGFIVPTKNPRGHVPDDDVADAYCIARWALVKQRATP